MAAMGCVAYLFTIDYRRVAGVGLAGLLVLMLGWWQVVEASDLRDRPGNLQTLQQERTIDRGRILSADGRVLAASRAVRVEGRRVYERIYPHGSLAAHAIGPHSSTLIQPLIQAATFGQHAFEVARGQYWIHPALAEVVENALLALHLQSR